MYILGVEINSKNELVELINAHGAHTVSAWCDSADMRLDDDICDDESETDVVAIYKQHQHEYRKVATYIRKNYG